MTLYLTGFRHEPADPFNEVLDEYGVKRELQARSERMWGEIEGHVKSAQEQLGLDIKYKLLSGLNNLAVFLERHEKECNLAGVWIGQTRVDVLPYEFSDYQHFESFKKGVRTARCVLAMDMKEEIEKIRHLHSKVVEVRGKGQHGYDRWTDLSMGAALNRFGDCQTLHTMTFWVLQSALNLRLGNHMRPTRLSDEERTIRFATKDETGSLVKRLMETSIPVPEIRVRPPEV